MGNRKTHIVIIFLLALFTGIYSQESYPSLGFWTFKSITGEVSLLGQYQDQKSMFNEISEDQNSKYFIGGLRLHTNSYLWQPDIISISLDGEFNPETRKEKYLSIPDRSEVRTLSKLDLRTTIFSDKSISLTSYLNLNQSYFNRENLTNVRSNNRQWGGLLSLNNKILPLNISFRNLNWDQLETESAREFNMTQNSVQANASRSFYGNDKHKLSYTFDDYLYTYADLNTINNLVNRVSLQDNFYFDENRNYAFNSLASYYKQTGNISFTKMEATERLIFHLPHDFDFNASYNYYFMDNISQTMNINRVRGSLRHQLYESLTSEIFADYSNTTHTYYMESDLKTGFEFRYTKKIPLGQLNLAYKYFRQFVTTESEESAVSILNEELSLSDLAGNFLRKPYVEALSITITDVTGSILYQEGLDYLVDEISNYTEITRIPGGQILQDQDVLVSYSAIQPGSNHYEANNNSFQASLSLLQRMLTIYYKGATQDFDNVTEADFLTLNNYNQHVVGASLYFKFLTSGVEYDYYNSSIIPYKRINYFLNIHFRIRSKFRISLNSSLRDYKIIGEDVNHQYVNVSGRMAYQITTRSKLNLQAAYLSQTGKSIDLDLITGRIEFTTNLRNLYFATGVNLYNKHYINSDFNYTRAYAKISRKF